MDRLNADGIGVFGPESTNPPILSQFEKTPLFLPSCHVLPRPVAAIRCRPASVFARSCHSARPPPPGVRNTPPAIDRKRQTPLIIRQLYAPSPSAPIKGNGLRDSPGNRPPKPGANAQAGPSPGGVIHRLSGPPVHGSVHATSALPGRWPTDPQHTVKIMRTKSLRRACTLIALLGIASALAACANTFNGMAQDFSNDTHAIQQAFSNH